MKKRFLLIPMVVLLAFFGCKKEELKDIQQDIELLNDSISIIISQHNEMLDSVSLLINLLDDEGYDVKALKMHQIGYLFESIARQPEASDALINATTMLYSDFNELLPISDQFVWERGQARGVAFANMFYAISRQPEVFNTLDSVATKFLGVYDPEYISDELLELTKVFSVTALHQSIARQPEADSLFNIVCRKYLNFEFMDE